MITREITKQFSSAHFYGSQHATISARKIRPVVNVKEKKKTEDLTTNPTLLLETLRRFADQHPDHTAAIEQILLTMMEPAEEPTAETEEEPPI